MYWPSWRASLTCLRKPKSTHDATVETTTTTTSHIPRFEPRSKSVSPSSCGGAAPRRCVPIARPNDKSAAVRLMAKVRPASLGTRSARVVSTSMVVSAVSSTPAIDGCPSTDISV
ncbi:MAG: hypothetical protein M5U28_20305 [Sandaracinaceae bacterium]|nr:hypothetical protein [Sandaracinaceae bacterium]